MNVITRSNTIFRVASHIPKIHSNRFIGTELIITNGYPSGQVIPEVTFSDSDS